MKIRIQFTPALTVALLCATGWFALWIFAFRPARPCPASPGYHPAVSRLIVDDETLSKLQAPTLFALPSDTGFSGQFIENQVDISLTLEKTNNPARYLSSEKIAASGADRSLLMGKIALPQSALPAPGSSPRPAIRPATGTQLFLSPELNPRASDVQINLATAGLPETVRVTLSVRADGTVASAFFDTPVTNTALLRAVRQLQFKPSEKPTDGWIDIRFAQEEK